jgi:hypothetical protein
MATSAGPLSAVDALAALAPIIGAGGISGIIIAVLGYLKGAKEGRRPNVGAAGQVGIATLYADEAAVQQAAAAIRHLVASIERLESAIGRFDGDKAEEFIDEIRKLRRAVEDGVADSGRHHHR